MAKRLPHQNLLYLSDGKRRVLRIVIGCTAAIVFAALLVRNIDLSGALNAAKRVPLHVLAASVFLVLAAYSIRAWRWQLMLEGAGVKTGYDQAASTFFAAFALNNVLPLRAGDIYRCVTASRFHDGTIAKSLATLFTERLLDLTALTAALGLLILFFGQAMFELISLPIGAILLFGVFILAFLIASPAMVRRVVNTVLLRLNRGPLVLNVAAWIERFIAAIEETLSPSTTPIILCLTALAWLLELGCFVVVGSAFGDAILWIGGFAAGVFGTLATLVPGAPGHLGTFDFFAAGGFRSAGLSPETAVAAAVISHIVVVVPVTLYGGLRLMTYGKPNEV